MKTYTPPDDNISFQIFEGDPAYVVTRYPRDMKGGLGRLPERLALAYGAPAAAFLEDAEFMALDPSKT